MINASGGVGPNPTTGKKNNTPPVVSTTVLPTATADPGFPTHNPAMQHKNLMPEMPGSTVTGNTSVPTPAPTTTPITPTTPTPPTNSTGATPPTSPKFPDPTKNLIRIADEKADKVPGGSDGKDTTKPKKKLNLKMVLGVVVLLLVVLGSGAGFYLSQQQQDLRQQAATDSIACGRITCSDGTTADYDCNYSGSCGDRVNAVCGIDDTNAYQDVAPEICTRGDDDDSYNCSSCVGSCGSTGCNTNCDGNTNPKTDCNIWSAGFVCEGRSRSGCNENNGSSSLPDPLDYANNPETWCKSYQFDSNAPNGAYSVVFVGDGGEVCVTIGGQPDTCNPDDLDWDCSSAPSSGDVSNACTPNQKWSEDGSLLSYDFTISNIQGEGNFDRSSFFFSFPGEKTRDQQMLIQFLGTPTWASDGTGSCNETNWCGYLIHTQETVSGTTASYTWTTNASNQPMIGGNQRSLKDISTFSRDTLDRPFRPKVEVNLVMGGVQTDSIGGFNIDVFPDACAQPAQSISKTWNITTEFICPDSTIPTEIGRRLFFLVWPPEPKVFNYNPKLDFGNGSTTSISQSITVDNITSDLIQNVYVGLVDASYFHTWWNDGDDNLETYLPISSYPGVVAGDFFSEPMYKWSVTDDSVPTNMTLQFEAPPELCEGEITLTCNDSCTPPATGETDQCSIDINENHSCINNKCRLISNPSSDSCAEPFCGDRIIQTPEVCDDGEDNSDTVVNACRTDCTLASCGDGVVDNNEVCDDGNQIDDDKCTNACTLPSCGDGIIQTPEVCDDGNTDQTDDCRNCQKPNCGDGIIDTGEACDDGNTTNGDGCSSTCTKEVALGCNGICLTTADCSDSNHICTTTEGGSLKCRLKSYPTSDTCTLPVSETTQPTLPPELPQSGPEDWLNWFKAGLVTLGLGAALFFLL